MQTIFRALARMLAILDSCQLDDRGGLNVGQLYDEPGPTRLPKLWRGLEELLEVVFLHLTHCVEGRHLRGISPQPPYAVDERALRGDRGPLRP